MIIHDRRLVFVAVAPDTLKLPYLMVREPARQLGVSERTIRRRVAAVLDLLGASSRFEAGVEAAQAGWL